MLGKRKSASVSLFRYFCRNFSSLTDGLNKSCTKHTRRADDDKHPKGDQGELTEFETCDKVEALDQLGQIMAPDLRFLKVIFLGSSSAELLIMLVTVSLILSIFYCVFKL